MPHALQTIVADTMCAKLQKATNGVESKASLASSTEAYVCVVCCCAVRRCNAERIAMWHCFICCCNYYGATSMAYTSWIMVRNISLPNSNDVNGIEMKLKAGTSTKQFTHAHQQAKTQNHPHHNIVDDFSHRKYMYNLVYSISLEYVLCVCVCAQCACCIAATLSFYSKRKWL